MARARLLSRFCTTASRPPPKSVRDAWHDKTFAAQWTHGGGAERTNPDRNRQIHLLSSLVSARCAAHLRAGRGHARVLDLGVGSGLAARHLLDEMPPDAYIVGVDESEAMLQLLEESHQHRRERLQALRIGFDELSSKRAALGLPPDGDEVDGHQGFACAVAVHSLHEVNDMTKRRALSFVRSALAPDGMLFILDRFNWDLESPLSEAHGSLWRGLHTSLAAEQQGYSWNGYLEYTQAKKDDAWASPQQCVTMCREAGMHAEVLYLALNRFLVAACPPKERDERKRRDFEAWRNEQVEKTRTRSKTR